jgi:hypothetical protein
MRWRLSVVLGVLALIASLAVTSGALAKSERPFKATTTITWNQFGPVLSGTGNSTHLGNTTASGSVSVNLANFPFSAGVQYTLTLTAANGDTLFVSANTTLTDTASPPAGNDYTESGTYNVTGGTGRFADATGSGTVAGSCTSSFGSPVATCTSSWHGTIRY